MGSHRIVGTENRDQRETRDQDRERECQPPVSWARPRDCFKMTEKGGQQLSFSFQIGLVKDKIKVDVTDLTLKSLKTLAVSFVNEKFHEHEITRLAERLLVFRHDYSSENILQTVNSVTDVKEGAVIELVLNTQPLGNEDVEIRPHSLVIHSYKTPTFCDVCKEMLFGMFKQGLKCEYCGLNIHKKCVKYLPKIPHTFVLHTFTKPTKCHFCNKLLVGVIKQGVQCKDCRYNAHKKCAERVPNDCTGVLPSEGLDGEASEESNDFEDRNGGESDEERQSPEVDDGSPIVTPSNFESHLAAQPTHSNIPVQRLVQSVKQTKRVGSKTIKEGWMVHFTNKDIMKKRHYWRLDSKSITMFKSETGPNYYKEVPLSEILSVEKSNGESGDPVFCFAIKTASVVFFVGEDSASNDNAAGAVSNKLAVTEFEAAIRSAVTPVVKTSSEAAVSKEEPSAAPVKEAKAVSVKVPEKEKEGRETEISKAYQIFPDEVLGSGQFGIVYGGVHRISGRAVAIKVIDKLRFPTKQEAALKNEVQILQNLSHPGVVNLERMFETPERIFVVMEKLRGDMLEMILSSEQGRLSERITEFLVTQILVALKHLHSKNIVHCDLKPENVLLSSDSDFPQVKLCDFGYARIIGKKSFRKSIVGTPAYLAPEVLYSNVLKKRGFNRSLDMWSTGVIIYVALSGQFPFNEDVDIEDQIKNAHFMYPNRPWRSISKEAVNCIQNLLVVEHEARYTVDDALADLWVSDIQCKADIGRLEEEVGEIWLTPVVDRRLSTYEHQH